MHLLNLTGIAQKYIQVKAMLEYKKCILEQSTTDG